MSERRYADLDARLVVQAWCASRGLLLLTALLVVFNSHRRLGGELSNWDVQHFMAIARNGYADHRDMAFFPALPAVMRALSQVGIPMVLTGVLLALAGSALAAWALFRIGGVAAACFWLIAPMTVFTAVPYTEAPFAAAAFWAWERALSNRWLPAALLAAIACSFRVSGVFLVLALAVLAAMQHRGERLWGRWALLLIPTLVVLGYVLWLHSLTGDWMAWFHAQNAGWGRDQKLHSPIAGFRLTWAAAHMSYWPGRHLVALVFMAEIVTVFAGAIVTVWCLVRREWAEATWVGVQVAVFATSYWWMSASRALLLWFPLFVLLGELASRRPSTELGRLVHIGLTTTGVLVSLAAAVLWSWLFFTGNWAG